MLQEALQAEKGRLQQLLAEEERAGLAAEAQHPADRSTGIGSRKEEDGAGKKGEDGSGKKEEDLCMPGEAEDELDAFMGQVAVQLEHDKVRHLSHVVMSSVVVMSDVDLNLHQC